MKTRIYATPAVKGLRKQIHLVTHIAQRLVNLLLLLLFYFITKLINGNVIKYHAINIMSAEYKRVWHVMINSLGHSPYTGFSVPVNLIMLVSPSGYCFSTVMAGLLTNPMNTPSTQSAGLGRSSPPESESSVRHWGNVLDPRDLHAITVCKMK